MQLIGGCHAPNEFTAFHVTRNHCWHSRVASGERAGPDVPAESGLLLLLAVAAVTMLLQYGLNMPRETDLCRSGIVLLHGTI